MCYCINILLQDQYTSIPVYQYPKPRIMVSLLWLWALCRYLSYVPHYFLSISDRSNLKEEEYILAPSPWWNTPSWQKNRTARRGAHWLHSIHSQEGKNTDAYVQTAFSSLFEPGLLSVKVYYPHVVWIFPSVYTISHRHAHNVFTWWFQIPLSWQSRLTIISALTFGHGKAVHPKGWPFSEGGPQSVTGW